MNTTKQAFVVQTRNQLQLMRGHLLRMESGSGDADAIDAVFRAVHNIFFAAYRVDGNADTNECQFIIEFTKILYDVLDEIRSESIAVTPALIEMLLACSGYLDMLVDCVEMEIKPTYDANKQGRSLYGKLKCLILVSSV